MSLYKMVELGTLIQQAKTVRCGSDDYPILSMTMHDGLVFQDDKFKKIIASKDRSDYKVVKRNQLVISFPIDEGVLAAQRIVDAGIVSPAYSIWDIDQEKILPEFLEYALRCDRALSYYKAKLRGSTARRRSLPTPTLLAFTVPLPGVSEQQFVLDVIHKAKKIIDNRSEEIQQLDNLVKARFVEMFGDPKTNPKNYPIHQLSEYIDYLTSGSRGWAQYCADDGPEWFITIKNVKDCRISVDNMQPVNAPDNAEAKPSNITFFTDKLIFLKQLLILSILFLSVKNTCNFVFILFVCIPIGLDVFIPFKLNSKGTKCITFLLSLLNPFIISSDIDNKRLLVTFLFILKFCLVINVLDFSLLPFMFIDTLSTFLPNIFSALLTVFTIAWVVSLVFIILPFCIPLDSNKLAPFIHNRFLLSNLAIRQTTLLDAISILTIVLLIH